MNYAIGTANSSNNASYIQFSNVGGAGSTLNYAELGLWNHDGYKVFGDGHFETASSGNLKVLNTTNATSTTTGALIVSGGAGLNNDLYIGGGLYFTNSASPSSFNYYEVNNTSRYFTYAFATNQQTTVILERIGGVVFVSMAPVSGVEKGSSNGTNIATSLLAIPSEFRPSAQFYLPIYGVINNSVTGSGYVSIDTSGIIYIAPSISGTTLQPFIYTTPANSNGWIQQNFSYHV